MTFFCLSAKKHLAIPPIFFFFPRQSHVGNFAVLIGSFFYFDWEKESRESQRNPSFVCGILMRQILVSQLCGKWKKNSTTYRIICILLITCTNFHCFSPNLGKNTFYRDFSKASTHTHVKNNHKAFY